MKEVEKKQAASRHKCHIADSSDEDDGFVLGNHLIEQLNNQSNSESDDYSAFTFYPTAPRAKRSKDTHYVAELIVKVEDKKANLHPIRALLDTGTSHTIILREFVKKGRAKGYKGKATCGEQWGGTFMTNQRVLIDFKFPELNTNKTITWITHVDANTDLQMAMHDMIIGMDLMTQVGICANTIMCQVEWEGHLIPLKVKGKLETHMAHTYHTAVNPTIIEAEQCQSRILDANYIRLTFVITAVV